MSNAPGTKTLGFNEPLIFERSSTGRLGVSLSELDVPDLKIAQAIPKAYVRSTRLGLPEVSEPEVMRHFVRLSTWNLSVDHNFYPLGSCTMKYNPKVNEWCARLPGLGGE